MSRKRFCRIVGGGPAGLYLALELARRDAGFDIELLHDEAPSHGVGVVLDADLVELLEGRDPGSGAKIRAACQTWDVVRLRLGDATLATGGHIIYGLDRGSLLAILRDRVHELGVRIVERRWAPQGDRDVDLLVGADGAGSRVRASRRAEFGSRSEAGRTWYLWMRASAWLPAGFLFARNEGGLLAAHVYPYLPALSAIVMECRPEAARAGLDGPGAAGREAAEQELTRLFADQTGGAELRAATYPWQPFRTVHNGRWELGDTVLIGDAAHTAHFSAGSGTRLAIEDAIALADELADDRSATAGAQGIADALARFEARRRPAVAAVQSDARGSQLWFEDLDRHMRLPPDQLAFALRTRRDANTYGWLRARDPAFVTRVDTVLRRDKRAAPETGAAAGPLADDPGAIGSEAAATERAAPSALPLRLGDLVAPNRVGVVLPRHLNGTRPGIVIAPDRAGVHAQPPDVVTGVACRVGMRAGQDECVVYSGQPAEILAQLEAEPHGHKATGVLTRSGQWDSADLRRLAKSAHFAVVPIGRHGQRVERTQFAEWLRNGLDMTVLLLAAEMEADEAETLIAAGRIDGYLLSEPGWTGWEA